MERQKSYDLTEGVIWKKLMIFFLPIAAGNLFQQLYNAADAIIVGKFVGTGALAAVGGSPAQVISVLVGFFMAMSGGSGVIIAQLYGAGDDEAVKRASATAILFSITAGLFLTAVGIPLAPWMLRAMKTPPDTLVEATLYLRVYFAGTAFVLLFNMGSGVLRALGDSTRPFICLVICCLCNIALDLLFVIVFKWGVAGAAIATVVSQLISAVFVLWQLFRARGGHFAPRKLVPDFALLKKMMHIGVPAGLQTSMYSVSNLLIQIAVNSLGTVVVAAWSMTGKIDGMYWVVSNALGAAVMSFVGQNYGAGKLDRIKKSVKVSLTLFMGITLALMGVILLVGRFGMGLFSDDPAVIEWTWKIMTYFVPYYFLWTFIEVLTGALRGVGDAIVPVVITGLGICALRIVWVLTVFARFHTVFGLSLCYPVSWLVTAVAMTVYYSRGRWNRLGASAESKK